MTDLPRVFADFNDLLGLRDRVRLDTVGARADLEAQGLEPSEGMQVVVYDHDLDDQGRRDDLVALATLEWDSRRKAWMAVLDTSTILNESQPPPRE